MEERDRFDRFTDRARKVMGLAQEEAQRFSHNYIGTEHLLLGMVREGEGTAARVLVALGVELNKARSAVEFTIGRGDHIVLGEIGLTPRAKKVIELAVDEARRLSHHHIGTEHLLLGLIREGEGIAAGVLQSLGLGLEQVRYATIQVMSGQEVTAHSAARHVAASHASMQVYLSLQTSNTAVGEQLDAQLAAAFGRERVCNDTMLVPLGWDWRDYLRRHVAACTFLLLVIGPDWLAAAAPEPPALGREHPVVIAVATALHYQKRIIPVCVQGATLPPADRLPAALRDLAYYRVATIRSDPDTTADIAALVAELVQTDWL